MQWRRSRLVLHSKSSQLTIALRNNDVSHHEPTDVMHSNFAMIQNQPPLPAIFLVPSCFRVQTDAQASRRPCQTSIKKRQAYQAIRQQLLISHSDLRNCRKNLIISYQSVQTPKQRQRNQRMGVACLQLLKSGFPHPPTLLIGPPGTARPPSLSPLNRRLEHVAAAAAYCRVC